MYLQYVANAKNRLVNLLRKLWILNMISVLKLSNDLAYCGRQTALLLFCVSLKNPFFGTLSEDIVFLTIDYFRGNVYFYRQGSV